jgi:ribosomal protein S18 acetylase RimI-like enzyme
MKKLPGAKKERFEIIRLQNDTFPDSCWSNDYLEKYFADSSRCPICITIRSEKDFVGFSIARLDRNSDSRMLLSALSVSPQFRGNGYGEKLIKKFFVAALDLPSLKKIRLHFRDSNKQIENFYARFGFQNHEICSEYSNGEKKHLMEIDRRKIEDYLAKFEH